MSSFLFPRTHARTHTHAHTHTHTHTYTRLPDLNFKGDLLLVGSKNELIRKQTGYTTWIDEILGTTFAPLVHLLNLQPK